MIPTPPPVIHDSIRAACRAAERNLAAEVRAVEDGHNCRLDRSRGLFIVASDSHPWQYALTAVAVGGLVLLTCTAEHGPADPWCVIPSSIQHHAKRATPGVLGCKHQALVCRRLSVAGLARWENGMWRATEKAEALGT